MIAAELPELGEQLARRVERLHLTACAMEAPRLRGVIARFWVEREQLGELVAGFLQCPGFGPNLLREMQETYRVSEAHGVDLLVIDMPFADWLRMMGFALRIDLSSSTLAGIGRAIAGLAEQLAPRAPNMAEVLSLIGTDILEAMEHEPKCES